MSFPIKQPIPKNPASYLIVKKVLSHEECKEIISLSDTLEMHNGRAGGEKEKRISSIGWIHPHKEVNSLFSKLADVVTGANENFWNFHLSGFMEPLQLTHYRSEEGGHYDWHEDRCDVGIAMNRKISGSLILNDNYEGGEFELFDTPPLEKLKRGDIILFPSFKGHRVNRVSKGERWSLVFWVTGPAFV
jgi:PKHD-type hydroxylase